MPGILSPFHHPMVSPRSISPASIGAPSKLPKSHACHSTCTAPGWRPAVGGAPRRRRLRLRHGGAGLCAAEAGRRSRLLGRRGVWCLGRWGVTARKRPWGAKTTKREKKNWSLEQCSSVDVLTLVLYVDVGVVWCSCFTYPCRASK